jgi:hypothetical protein
MHGTMNVECKAVFLLGGSEIRNSNRQPWQFGDRHYAVPKSTVAANTQSCKRVFITGFADKQSIYKYDSALQNVLA